MASGNASKRDVGESSTNQNSFLISASCRILQDLSDVYINPLESISMDAESPCFQIDSSNETPNKYPNAPQSSPIDAQNDKDISVFNEELMKCLSNLPVILLTSEENRRNSSYIDELPVFHTEDDTSVYSEIPNYADSEVVSENCKVFEERHEKFGGNCSEKSSYVPWNRSEGKSGSTGGFVTNVGDEMGKINLLRVNSAAKDFNRDFNRRSTFSDNESTIANCASDISDISSEEEEIALSDGSSSCASRDRIEFEALALDSTIYSSIFKGLQHCKTLSRNKRALSLDEMNPLKALHAIDFSTTEFQLTV